MAVTSASTGGSQSFDLTVHGHRQTLAVLGIDTVVSGVKSSQTVLGLGHDTVAAFGLTGTSQSRLAVTNPYLAHTAEMKSFNAGLGRATLIGSGGRETSHGGAPTLANQPSIEKRTSIASSHEKLPTAKKGGDVLAFLKSQKGSAHLIQDFTSAQHKHAPAISVESLRNASSATVTSHGGSTFINLDGGKTTIELHGLSHLQTSFDTHRH